MYAFARLLQILGLIEAGYGLFIGLYEQDIDREVRFAGLGIALFLAGWLIQRRWKA